MPEDLKRIEDYLIGQNVKFIIQPLMNNTDIISEKIKFPKGSFRSIFLVHQDYIDKIQVDYMDAQNYYMVDEWKSYVIEFDTGGFFNKDELGRARFYYIKS